MIWTRTEVVLTVVGLFVWLVGALLVIFTDRRWPEDHATRRVGRVLMIIGGASLAAGVTSFALP